MADLDKRLKECRDEMYDLNKTQNKSKKRNLMIQSQSTDNYKSGPRGFPINPYSPTNNRIGGRGYPISSTSIVVAKDSKVILTTTFLISKLQQIPLNMSQHQWTCNTFNSSIYLNTMYWKPKNNDVRRNHKLFPYNTNAQN